MPDPKLILLVDDSMDDRYIARRRLSKRWPSLEIAEVTDGLHAIEFLESSGKTPDLILLDINMPRMDGHEFLSEWYKDKGNHMPLVVMLTSSDQTLDIERAEALECVMGYLVKPMTQAQLDDLPICA